MLILGVDPGTARLGWGTVKEEKGNQSVGDYGCIETPKSDPEPLRLKKLYDQFVKLIKTHQPDAIAVEDIFFFKNQKTVIKISQARGVILLAGQIQKIPTFSYTPLQIKQAVTGYGRADKNQVSQMTKSILKLDSIPKPDDTADALAVALTHAFSYKTNLKIR